MLQLILGGAELHCCGKHIAEKKRFPFAAFPQRLEAAIDSAAVTARVELVPFPKPSRTGVFPQAVKPCPT
jgi:hypothetical protein